MLPGMVNELLLNHSKTKWCIFFFKLQLLFVVMRIYLHSTSNYMVYKK